MKRNFYIGAIFVGLLVALGVARPCCKRRPSCKPPADLRRLASKSTRCGPPASECCLPAPPVLEFDEEGNLIGH